MILSWFQAYIYWKKSVIWRHHFLPYIFSVIVEKWLNFINDLFFSITKSEVGNFADDNTLYSSNKDIDHVFNDLYYDLNVLDWFKFNSLKANPDKFQFIILGANKNKSFSINVRGINIPSKNEVILLAITTDHELKFNKHIEDLCKRVFFSAARFLENKEIPSNWKSENSCKCIYWKSVLLCSLDMDVCFKNGNKNGNSLQLSHVKSYRFGINSLRFRGSMLWNNLPFSVKNSETLTDFKNKLKTLENIHCTCEVCR